MEVIEQTEKRKPDRNSLWSKLWSKGKLSKPQRIAVIYLRKNNQAEPIVAEAKKGFFVIHDRTYHVERDCIYNLGKERVPFAIIEEEGLKAWGNADFLKKMEEAKGIEKVVADFQNLALNAIRHAELVKLAGEEGKGKLNPKYVIGGLILLAIGYAVYKAYSGGG